MIGVILSIRPVMVRLAHILTGLSPITGYVLSRLPGKPGRPVVQRWVVAGTVALGTVFGGLGNLAGANQRWGTVVYVNTPSGYALNSRWGPGTEFGIHTQTRRNCPLELSGASRRGWLQLTNGTWVASNWVSSAPRDRMACLTSSTPNLERMATVATPVGYGLNVRSGPGRNYTRIGQYRNGMRVFYTGRFNGAWTELADGNWVDGSFLRFENGQGPPPTTPPPRRRSLPTPTWLTYSGGCDKSVFCRLPLSSTASTTKPPKTPCENSNG